MDAGAHVGGTTNNLQRFGGADLHPAHAQLVGIGMGIALLHEAHHHPSGLGGEILQAIELEAGHGQALTQFGGWKITGHKLPQPLERDPHRLNQEVGSILGTGLGSTGSGDGVGCCIVICIATAAQRPYGQKQGRPARDHS